MRANHRRLLALLPVIALAACGGGGSGQGSHSGNPHPARGTLLQDPPELVSSVSAAELLLDLDAPGNELWLAHGGAPFCDVAIYRIRYATVGGADEESTASGALMVPSGSDSRCHGARPIVLYAHGTRIDRDFNIADLNDSSNAEGLYLAAFFASQGYIVVAPNYAGYDTSTLAYHPYLVGDQQSKDMIDALTAARSALPTALASSTTDDGRLYITGYSQGGYVAMATHRAMQEAGMTVTASAPMSGPYTLAAFGDAIFMGRVNAGAPIEGTWLITAYQRSYGTIYATASDLFADQYAPGIDSLLPTSLTRSQLYAQGKLPHYAFFSATPPDPAYASITPATTPENLDFVFARGFGDHELVRNSFRLSYLLDAQANPDGGWPDSTTGVPATSPGLPLRQALKLNDLRNWTPAAPTLLCGGNADPSVFWLNTLLMQGYWASHAPPPATDVVLDLDTVPSNGDPYASLKNDFALAKEIVAATAVAGGATDGGASAVADVYHGGLVPPFCLEAVKSFFADH
jgi:hypothetical protein